jgi:hypothetical protein
MRRLMLDIVIDIFGLHMLSKILRDFGSVKRF